MGLAIPFSDLPDVYPTAPCVCPECGGSGQVTTVDYVPYGDGYTPLEQNWECDLCAGTGEVSEAIRFGHEAGWLG